MRPISLPLRPGPRTTGLGLLVAVSLVAAACSAAAPSTPAAPAGAGAPAGSVAAATASPGGTAAGGASGGRYGGGAASSAAASVTITAAKAGSLGTVLTGDGGRTLYVFKKDAPDASVCNGGCASTWPPLTVASASAAKAGSGATGALATITRSDGSLQVTYDHAPLYYYSGDHKAGDATGQGFGGLWFAATPTAGGTPAATPSGGGYGY